MTLPPSATPPLTAPPLTIAPVWRRLAALIYDTLILLAISFAYGAAVTTIAIQQGSTAEEHRPMFESPFFLMGWLFCLLAFYCWFWHKSGQTLGMRTWRLKLINEAGTKHSLTWVQCIIRSLVSAPTILLFGLGYWYCLFNRDKSCLHDKLSKTHVIVIKKGG